MPLASHDFLLTKIDEQYRPWTIEKIDNAESLWQRAKNKDDILAKAQPYIASLKDCVGQDLDDYQIQELLSSRIL